jgi:hypothetical protein
MRWGTNGQLAKRWLKPPAVAMSDDPVGAGRGEERPDEQGVFGRASSK